MMTKNRKIQMKGASKEIMKQMLEHKKKHDKLHIGEEVQVDSAPQIREYGNNIVIVHHTK